MTSLTETLNEIIKNARCARNEIFMSDEDIADAMARATSDNARKRDSAINLGLTWIANARGSAIERETLLRLGELRQEIELFRE